VRKRRKPTPTKPTPEESDDACEFPEPTPVPRDELTPTEQEAFLQIIGDFDISILDDPDTAADEVVKPTPIKPSKARKIRAKSLRRSYTPNYELHCFEAMPDDVPTPAPPFSLPQSIVDASLARGLNSAVVVGSLPPMAVTKFALKTTLFGQAGSSLPSKSFVFSEHATKTLPTTARRIKSLQNKLPASVSTLFMRANLDQVAEAPAGGVAELFG
jgi:hypothetical protein